MTDEQLPAIVPPLTYSDLPPAVEVQWTVVSEPTWKIRTVLAVFTLSVLVIGALGGYIAGRHHQPAAQSAVADGASDAVPAGTDPREAELQRRFPGTIPIKCPRGVPAGVMCRGKVRVPDSFAPAPGQSPDAVPQPEYPDGPPTGHPEIQPTQPDHRAMPGQRSDLPNEDDPNPTSGALNIDAPPGSNAPINGGCGLPWAICWQRT